VIENADAVVIGGGIMGASTAHFLTKMGFGEVALVEKRKVCGGSTQYSAAHVRQHYSNEVGIRLAVRGAAMIANAEEELGGPAGFVQIGYMLFAPPEGEQGLRDVIPVQQGFFTPADEGAEDGEEEEEGGDSDVISSGSEGEEEEEEEGGSDDEAGGSGSGDEEAGSPGASDADSGEEDEVGAATDVVRGRGAAGLRCEGGRCAVLPRSALALPPVAFRSGPLAVGGL